MMNRTRIRRAPHLPVLVAGGAAVAISLSGCGAIDRTDKASSDRSAATTSAAKAAPSPTASPSAKAAPPAKAAPQARAAPSAKVLYQQMRKSVAAANSVRIKGAVTDSGTKLTIDVAGDRDGTNARALVNDGTGEAELLTTGGNTYVKADAAYWTKNGSAALAKVAAGRYVKIPAGSGVADGLKVSKLLDGVFTDLPLAGALQKVVVTDLDGAPAYLLTDRIGSGDGKIYVSADGKSNLLRLVSTKGSAGSLAFSDWNAVRPVKAPPASKILKIPGQP
jgi:hypothetical protein